MLGFPFVGRRAGLSQISLPDGPAQINLAFSAIPARPVRRASGGVGGRFVNRPYSRAYERLLRTARIPPDPVPHGRFTNRPYSLDPVPHRRL